MSDAAPGPRVLPYGEDGLLVEVGAADRVRALDAALRAARPEGVVDVVPAARTVLVRGDARVRPRWAAAVREVVEGLAAPVAGRGSAEPSRTVEVPVVYDGEDLAEVAALTGRSVDEVVARHLAGGPDGYRVAFGGFMPGFAYVVGLDPVLHVPRRGSPRTRVPAGSVAVAGAYTAVYPAPTPGGWRLLGTTTASMFDPDRGRARAALLAPGDAVRFVRASPAAVRAADRADVPTPVSAGGGRTAAQPPEEPAPTAGRPAGEHIRTAVDHSAAEPVRMTAEQLPAGPVRALTVLATGPLALVQDAGRPGLADVGVPRSGAADPDAARAANRLVGTAGDAAVVEVLLGGLVVTFGATTAVALTGAPAPAVLDGVPVPHATAVRAPAGSTLTLTSPGTGLRTWLAVRGGLDVAPVLGSRAHDQLSGLGPAPLRAGDVLAYGSAFDGLPDLGPPAWTSTAVDRTSGAAEDPTPGTDDRGTTDRPAPGTRDTPGPGVKDGAEQDAVVDLPALDGPLLDRLDAAGQDALWRTVWTVTPASNRVAVRLDGPPLTRDGGGELPSEGVVAGAVQVPHDGRPVLFGPDHPVTGGYPVVAVLTRDGRARAAQLRPGDRVRLVRRER